MSAIGTKQTSSSALHMSAFDPKPTWRLLKDRRSVVWLFSLAARSQSARLYLGSTCGGANSSKSLPVR
jgi:hypothetical protein